MLFVQAYANISEVNGCQLTNSEGTNWGGNVNPLTDF
jgi:hypothetical protein